MKKQFLFSAILLSLSFSYYIQAQTKEPKKHNPEVFDEEAALSKAKAKGIKASDLKGYVNALHLEFSLPHPPLKFQWQMAKIFL